MLILGLRIPILGILSLLHHLHVSECFVTAPFVTETFLTASLVRKDSRSDPVLACRLGRSRLHEQQPDKKDGGGSNPLSFLFDPYESKIPDEIKKEIYEAEANTPAARDRNKRIGLYALAAFIGVGMAFFNGFLSELRGSETPDGLPFNIQESPFAWLDGNFLTKFLFMNKIGGLLCLLSGAGAGLLAEAELDTRRLNAEKIYQELLRRREKKESQKASASSRKKKRPGKRENKRMGALAEVMDDKMDVKPQEAPNNPSSVSEDKDEGSSETKKPDDILSSIKGFYEKADNMAASQALMLNKQLEDAGVLDKITDETGMLVIGRKEAAKLANKQKPGDEADIGKKSN